MKTNENKGKQKGERKLNKNKNKTVNSNTDLRKIAGKQKRNDVKKEKSAIEKKRRSKKVEDAMQKSAGSERGLFFKVKKLYQENREKKYFQISSKIFTSILFLVGLYLVAYPFIPAIVYKIFYEGKNIYPYETRLESKDSEGEFGGKDIPSENRLVIPSIGVDMPIVEGSSEATLNLGVWHRPATGYPGSGNMVLTGHRVGYAFLPEDIRNSTSFYNLDKLKNGDYVIVYWNGEEYDYEVYNSEVVDKTATYIESQDTGERLTLYTCHPVGQNNLRLVYYARRIEEN